VPRRLLRLRKVHTAERTTTDPFPSGTGDVVLGTMPLHGEASGLPYASLLTEPYQGINFSSPEDVLEVLQSLNRTPLPGRQHNRDLDSYLCVVERTQPHVYIACIGGWQKALVYIPEKQRTLPRN